MAVLASTAGLVAIVLLDACTSASRRQAFDFFFDPEEIEQMPVRPDDTSIAEQGQPVAAVSLLDEEKKRFQHSPFAQKECEKCHVSRMSNKMKDPMPGLCFNCHTNYLTGREEIDVHKPVFKGQCLKCHEAHSSMVTNLLKFAGADLCFKCHDEVATERKVVHKPVAEGKCDACHLAHASPNKALLVKPAATLCGDCHKPYARKFVHKPVSEGKCMGCHSTHSSNHAGLVKRAGNAQCTICHAPEDMNKVARHKGAEAMGCAECHEVHHSELPHLMKPGAPTPP